MPRIRRRTNLGRRTRNAMNQINYQSNRTAQERQYRNERERIRVRKTREARHSTNNSASLNRAAFCYDMSIAYSAYTSVAIGPMNSVCQYCKALKCKNEAKGLCCANGKVKLIPLHPPPEPLFSLVLGIETDSIHFLNNIQRYNCFQMTSFEATKTELSTLDRQTHKLSISHTEILSTVPPCPCNPVVKEEKLEKPVDEVMKQEAVCEEPRILINKVEPECDDDVNNSWEAEPEGYDIDFLDGRGDTGLGTHVRKRKGN